MEPPIEFDELDSFIPGAVGEPGARVFYLQARAGNRVVSFRLEKEQVGMLGRYLGQLAAALGATEPDRDVTGLIEPIEPQWIVGTISVGVDESTGIIQVLTEELVLDDSPDSDFDDRFESEFDDPELNEVFATAFGEVFADDDEPTGAQARFTLRAEQAAAFAEAAMELMSGGRPPCRLCGKPIGPSGHACPRWN